MVEHRVCSFCGEAIEPGTGSLYVRRDGTQFLFCSSKCRKNLTRLGRQPRYFKWTRHFIKGGAK
jgi:large subunit ribosomal protein L24e